MSLAQNTIRSLLMLLPLLAAGCKIPAVMLVASSGQPGDVDGNGTVDIWDARSLDRSLASDRFRVLDPASGDVSQNQQLDRGDLEAIEKRAHGISTLSVMVGAEENAPVVIGGVVTLQAADTFLPLNVKSGTVRIRSSAAEYDSGSQPLTHAENGRFLYYHWDTSDLIPADDYIVEVNLRKQPPQPLQPPPADSGGKASAPEKRDAAAKVDAPDRDAPSSTEQPLVAESSAAPPTDVRRDATAPEDGRAETDAQATAEKTSSAGDGALAQAHPASAEPGDLISFRKRIQVRLVGRPREPALLAEAVDLSLPYWGLGLELARRYYYTSTEPTQQTSFGRGWTHSYGIQLREHTDGMVEVLGGGPLGHWFREAEDGQYQPAGGNPHRLTRDPDGSFQLLLTGGEVWTFNTDLRPVSVRDDQSHSIDLEYDDQNRLMAIADESGQRISITYDAEGLISHINDSAGRTVTYKYDPEHNLVAASGPAGRAVGYQYDAQQRLVAITSGDHVWQKLAYDDSGRLAAVAEPESTTLEYSVATIGPGGRTLHTPYGGAIDEQVAANGQLLRRRFGEGFDSIEYTFNTQEQRLRLLGNSEITNEISRDPTDGTVRLTATGEPDAVFEQTAGENEVVVTDANRIKTTVRQLDTGEPTHILHPDGTYEVRLYEDSDEGRHVQRQLRSGQVAEYWYDDRGLLQSKNLGPGLTSRYRYDARGNLLSASNARGEITFKYDDRSRLVSCTYPGNRTFRYEYDDLDRRIAMVDPDGHRCAYQYDDRDRLVAIHRGAKEPLVAYEYEAGRIPARRNFGNGVRVSISANSIGDITSLHLNDLAGNVLASHSYSYDGAGRRTQYKSQRAERAYDYDQRGRLIAAVEADAEPLSLTYDPAGNRTSVSRAGVSERYASTVLNQYSAVGGVRRSFDLNGNLNARTLAGQRTAYEYDAENHLLRVRLPDRTYVLYEYDPLGRLASRTFRGETVRYLWDGDQLALMEDERHQTLQVYVWGSQIDELVAVAEGDHIYYCSQDALSSVTEITDSEGTLVGQIGYSPFGSPNGEGWTDLPFRFTAALFDPATGLHCMRHRWYEAETGTYLQPHPMAPFGTAHPYAYADNDPVNRKVPRGFRLEAPESQLAWGPAVRLPEPMASNLSPQASQPRRGWVPVGDIIFWHFQPGQLPELNGAIGGRLPRREAPLDLGLTR